MVGGCKSLYFRGGVGVGYSIIEMVFEFISLGEVSWGGNEDREDVLGLSFRERR